MESLQKLCLSILLFCISLFAYAQDSSENVISKKKFLIDKHWQKYNYHSEEWQIYLDSALFFEPQNAYLWQQKSMPLFKSGKYASGMQYLNKAVQYDSIRYLGYRGFMKCIFMKYYESSIYDFKSIYIMQPSQQMMDHSYPFWIGLSYLKLDKLDSAKAFLDISINNVVVKYGNDWVHFNERFYKSICLFKLKDYENALLEFDETLRLNSNFSDAQYYKSKTLLALNREEESLKLLYLAKENSEKGYTINEDNESYVDYPFQIKLKEINDLISLLEK